MIMCNECRDIPQVDRTGSSVGTLVSAPTKRERVPSESRDWLARACAAYGFVTIAEALFPRLWDRDRSDAHQQHIAVGWRAGLATHALLAGEVNGDVYLVGRDPWTGQQVSLPTIPPAAPCRKHVARPERQAADGHQVVVQVVAAAGSPVPDCRDVRCTWRRQLDPQHLRIVVFASEAPWRTDGYVVSLKAWSFRWEGGIAGIGGEGNGWPARQDRRALMGWGVGASAHGTTCGGAACGDTARGGDNIAGAKPSASRWTRAPMTRHEEGNEEGSDEFLPW